MKWALVLCLMCVNVFAATPPPPNKITDRASCTLTYGCNTNGTHAAKCWRVNDVYCIESVSTYTGASDSTNCDVTLDGGKTIATAKLSGNSTFSNQTASMVGAAQWFDNGNQFEDLQVLYYDANTVVANRRPGLMDGSSLASGDSLKFNFCVPITGW